MNQEPPTTRTRKNGVRGTKKNDGPRLFPSQIKFLAEAAVDKCKRDGIQSSRIGFCMLGYYGNCPFVKGRQDKLPCKKITVDDWYEVIVLGDRNHDAAFEMLDAFRKEMPEV